MTPRGTSRERPVSPELDMVLALLAPPPHCRALIFDCDGTLADTLPIHYQAWADVVRQFGGHMPKSWYFQRVGVSTVELIDQLNQSFGLNLPMGPVKQAKHQRFAELLSGVQPIVPVVEVVYAFAGKLPLAVASGGSRPSVDRTLAHLGLTDLFQTIVTIEDVAQGKPAPDLFLKAAQRLQCRPQDCVVYEDSEVGVQAAQAAQMGWVKVAVGGRGGGTPGLGASS